MNSVLASMQPPKGSDASPVHNRLLLRVEDACCTLELRWPFMVVIVQQAAIWCLRMYYQLPQSKCCWAGLIEEPCQQHTSQVSQVRPLRSIWRCWALHSIADTCH